jgi:hypothetical protein
MYKTHSGQCPCMCAMNKMALTAMNTQPVDEPKQPQSPFLLSNNRCHGGAAAHLQQRVG